MQMSDNNVGVDLSRQPEPTNQVLLKKAGLDSTSGKSIKITDWELGFTRVFSADGRELTWRERASLMVLIERSFQGNANAVLRDYGSNLTTRMKSRSGFVYIASDASKGIFKIGFSESPGGRIAGLRTGNHGIEMIHMIQGEQSLERSLHQVFSKKRVGGEWFSLSESDVEFLKTL